MKKILIVITVVFSIVTVLSIILPLLIKSDLQKGKDYFKKQDYENAITSLTKSVALNPKEQQWYFFRGAVYSAMDQCDKAIQDYTETIKLSPQYWEAYWSRGYCYAQKLMYDDAISDYTKSLELGSEFTSHIYWYRGNAYFQKWLLEEAEKDFQSALKLDPTNKEVKDKVEFLDSLKKCSKHWENKNTVPFSSHLSINYPVDDKNCYIKEADLSPDTNTISLQKIEGTRIVPIFRIINHYNYKEVDWISFKEDIKQKNVNNYEEINVHKVPFFSAKLKEKIGTKEVIMTTNCNEKNNTCYYFTDQEGMYLFIPYKVDAWSDARIFIDYQ